MEQTSAAEAVSEALSQGPSSVDSAQGLHALPGGKVRRIADMQKYMGMAFKIRDSKEFLFSPEVLLKRPDSGRKYGWPVRNARTDGLIRSGAYRVINPDEMKEGVYYEVTTHEGVGGAGSKGAHIEWYNHILVEIHPDYYNEYFVSPAFRGLNELVRYSEQFASDANTIVPGARTSVAVTAAPNRG